MTLIDLGRTLFYDRHLSSDGTMSCSSCHEPDKYFSDQLPKARGDRHRALTRNTPSLVGVADESSYFWDGRAETLEIQINQVLLNPAEFGSQSGSDITHRLAHDPGYLSAFHRLFPGKRNSISVATISKAIAAYERTLVPAASSFDRYFYQGRKGAIPAAAIKGFELFRGRANCASCHTIGPRPSPLSDGRFHTSPVRLPEATDRDLVQLTRMLIVTRAAKRDVTGLISTNPEVASLGRFAVTLRPIDISRFKTPSLRNVAVTAPYMHDGSVPTLQQAVELELYSRRNSDHRPIVLSEAEINDIVEFLKSLTSPAKSSP